MSAVVRTADPVADGCFDFAALTDPEAEARALGVVAAVPLGREGADALELLRRCGWCWPHAVIARQVDRAVLERLAVTPTVEKAVFLAELADPAGPWARERAVDAVRYAVDCGTSPGHPWRRRLELAGARRAVADACAALYEALVAGRDARLELREAGDAIARLVHLEEAGS